MSSNSNIVLMLAVAAIGLSSCSTNKQVSTSGFLQKRQHMKGWHWNIPDRGRDKEILATHHMRQPLVSAPTPELVRPVEYEPVALVAADATPVAAAVDGTVAQLDRSKATPKIKWTPARRPVKIQHNEPLSDRIQANASNKPAPTGAAPEGEGKDLNTLALLGFIFAFLLPLVGLILCIIALGQIKKTGERGHGLAQAGLILSIVFLVLLIILL